MKRIILGLVFLAATAQAAKNDSDIMYLVAPDGMAPWLGADDRLPAARLFAVARTTGSPLLYVLTDDKGALAHPREFLDRGSVLPARAFGLPTSAGYFRLDRDGRWRPTPHRRARLWLYVDSPAPRVRVDWYETNADREKVVAAARRLLNARIKRR